METPKQTLDYAAALARAERYCAQAEHCLYEVRHKLRLWGAQADEIPAILDSLVERGFVDEARYARAFARDKHRFSGWGAQRIASQLRARHLASADIATAVAELQAEFDTADKLRTLLTSRYRTLPASLPRARAYERLMRYGLYRGYSYDAVASVVSSLLGSPDEP